MNIVNINARALRICVVEIAVFGISLPTACFALGTENERAACTQDVFRLCNSEIPNVDDIVSCMKAKKASLSASCRAVFDKAPALRAARD